MMLTFLLAAAGFLLGGVLFSYQLPKWLRGVDITQRAPDHNPGAFNAIRQVGWRVGLLGLACDLLKGTLPVAAARLLLDPGQVAFALVMAAPVLGHAIGPYNRGHGGKGIAASFGVLLGLLPYSFSVLLLAGWYLLLSLLVRPHRLRSILTYAAFGTTSAAIAWMTGRYAVGLGSLLVSVIVIARHLLQPQLDAGQTDRISEKE